MTYGCKSTLGNTEWSPEIASEINRTIIPFEIHKYDDEELFYLGSDNAGARDSRNTLLVGLFPFSLALLTTIRYAEREQP